MLLSGIILFITLPVRLTRPLQAGSVNPLSLRERAGERGYNANINSVAIQVLQPDAHDSTMDALQCFNLPDGRIHLPFLDHMGQ